MIFYEAESVKNQPVFIAQSWRIVKFTPENYHRPLCVICCSGNPNFEEHEVRRSTEIMDISEMPESDEHWLATTESGRTYVLPKEGVSGQDRNMVYMLKMLEVEKIVHEVFTAEQWLESEKRDILKQ